MDCDAYRDSSTGVPVPCGITDGLTGLCPPRPRTSSSIQQKCNKNAEIQSGAACPFSRVAVHEFSETQSVLVSVFDQTTRNARLLDMLRASLQAVTTQNNTAALHTKQKHGVVRFATRHISDTGRLAPDVSTCLASASCEPSVIRE